ncbi:hypothetical protein HMP09_0285 [Sphingomonas sp. HMP9]|uniref:hypothetical protein n=1 Tax=Sphingomonas sp. HMP9 TaxID=1517554 RepID=UPI001596CA35|nr:hypothetical protein [Sphingomonas sp. HMP9]BCA61051.1 hypothetical protein HMP09_0285 [Sphingomonas sp. HMP9]
MADAFTWSTALPVIFGSSVVSALVTQFVTSFRERRSAKGEVAYLALRLAAKFERFAEDAAGVVGDIKDFAAGAEEGVNTELPQMQALPDEKERWRDLDVALTSRVLAFDEYRRSRQGSIDQTWRYGGDTEAIDTAHAYAILLGLKALKLSGDLRSAYELPPFDTPSLWPKFLTSQFDDLPDPWKTEA